ncbi:MAG: MarR family transcriptional regulator, partial [bacterium]|nr:MarR family transcriptional regulator [bacterium]
MNVINESGILAISTRLQRLSEQLRKDGALLY